MPIMHVGFHTNRAATVRLTDSHSADRPTQSTEGRLLAQGRPFMDHHSPCLSRSGGGLSSSSTRTASVVVGLGDEPIPQPPCQPGGAGSPRDDQGLGPAGVEAEESSSPKTVAARP